MKVITSLFVLMFSSQLFASPQYCDSHISATTPSKRFKVVENEVIDNKTGLVWQRCALGQKDNNCSGQAQTYTWSEAKTVAYKENQKNSKGWRLPDVVELKSLIEYKCYNPAINLDIFPKTPGGFFWTGDVHEKYSNYAWYVYFYYGYAYHYYVDKKNYIRLVRNP